ncbi:winged helix-turn-helix domain-containing protein [Sphingomonas sp. HITSZ_GF]|uniref:winged helix-turn-helix domain-containing protein n=1 Tax=Sphingomonas sp. HITSZ_GF TaxID=3037247 RepID=UPI00240E71F6|nr:winged helix-turn-helix domain-containing protein [Sphingomonas sp. HITSZ_GF]MDG2533226.1 winged helix-turn-helix domain-containing protein [Sphingomonas sp. HITSZ_GF]
MEGRIDLAHEAPFRLGTLEVRPALRQLARDDCMEDVLEPRVMQVLVALARADGAIVSRDDLTRSCWEGRVVGEDAINRVVSRLRRAAEGIGQGSFRIETITKVGYRLLREGQGEVAPAEDSPLARARAEAHRLRLDRRAMLAGAGLAVVTVGGGLYTWRHFIASDPALTDKPPPDVAPLMIQAQMAMTQGTVEGGNQAIGLLRRVVSLRPDYADGWGLLALSYSAAAVGRPQQYEADMRARAAEARRRALALDPGNAYARAADGLNKPVLGNWTVAERGLRTSLASHPHNDMLVSSLAGVMLGVGRCTEAANLIDGIWKRVPPNPGLAYTHVQTLWAAGRPDEADKAMDDAVALFPTHFAVWFTRFYLLMYTGRVREAIALGENRGTRPTGIPEWNFEQVLIVARAMLSRAPRDIEAAAAISLEGAHRGAGFAENGIQFLSGLGRVDEAFAVADAYYFARGFDPGELRFSTEQGTYTRRNARRTHLLFLPPTASMRTDARFLRLADELGLVRYWKDAGVRPDYQATG